MVRSLKIFLWDDEVGRLSWDERRRLTYFTYNPDFVKKGLNIAPFVAPINGVRILMPIWGEEEKIYHKLPAFLADSLPDAWGNQLFDLWRHQNHLSNSDITPLDKLSFIGKRGMGALEFVPETGHEQRMGKIDVKSLSDLAERIFNDREKAHILPDESITVQSLLTVGTSAGGRQPKAIIAINENNGEIRSGQIAKQEGYEYYLLKFGNSTYSSAELEMTYYELASNAGISMMHSELMCVEGNNHFLTKRFDRVDGRKVYTQTLAAVSPATDSYEGLIDVCRKLRIPESDCQEIFRRMVFNILANNTDDHHKNFSFIMSDEGAWRLSPAYDITYVINKGGFQPDDEHCMYIRAKLRDVTKDDVLQFARDNGIRRPETIIRDVVDSLMHFRSIAAKYGVGEQWIGRVEKTIYNHLTAWGEVEEKLKELSFTINNHTISDIRLEQTYKGNYHLYAAIDGTEKRYIIGKNKPEYSVIERFGITNIPEEQLKEILAHLID